MPPVVTRRPPRSSWAGGRLMPPFIAQPRAAPAARPPAEDAGEGPQGLRQDAPAIAATLDTPHDAAAAPGEVESHMHTAAEEVSLAESAPERAWAAFSPDAEEHEAPGDAEAWSTDVEPPAVEPPLVAETQFAGQWEAPSAVDDVRPWEWGASPARPAELDAQPEASAGTWEPETLDEVWDAAEDAEPTAAADDVADWPEAMDEAEPTLPAEFAPTDSSGVPPEGGAWAGHDFSERDATESEGRSVAERVAGRLEDLAHEVRRRGLAALGAGAHADEKAKLDELSRLIAAVVVGYYGREA